VVESAGSSDDWHAYPPSRLGCIPNIRMVRLPQALDRQVLDWQASVECVHNRRCRLAAGMGSIERCKSSTGRHRLSAYKGWAALSAGCRHGLIELVQVIDWQTSVECVHSRLGGSFGWL